VLVEGAGGLLVRFADDGWTLADLARTLAAPVLVVAAAGLGTLNHTALTLECLAGRGVRHAGVVIGSWPARPGLAERTNLRGLAMISGRPLAGALAEGAPDAVDFVSVARHGLSPALGGSFDAADFGLTFDDAPASAPLGRTRP
jgi:dethiobiotin synthetase